MHIDEMCARVVATMHLKVVCWRLLEQIQAFKYHVETSKTWSNSEALIIESGFSRRSKPNVFNKKYSEVEEVNKKYLALKVLQGYSRRAPSYQNADCDVSVRQKPYYYSINMKMVSNRASHGRDSFVFTELWRHVVVYVRGAILYTGTMFSPELKYLIYKISAKSYI